MLIPMKNLIKLVMLGLLPVAFAAVINLGNAYAEEVTVEFRPGAQFVGCEVEDKCLNPSTITVPVGTTVKWINNDGAGHTVTGGDANDPATWGTLTIGGAVFDSSFPLIKPRGEWSFTFTEEGEFPYVCQVHPWNVGKVIVGGEAPPPPPPRPENAMVIATDNGSVDVQVTIDKGMVHGSDFMVDPPQGVKFDIKFLDPTTGQPLQHVNYQFHVTDKSGAMVAHEVGQHSMGGTESKSVAFSNTGSYTLMIVVEGTGINKPFDTAHSGTASSTITVTPEFPLSVMAIMAAVVGIGVAATRFKSLPKL